MTESKAAKAEREEEKDHAIKVLRETFKPGDTVTTVIRHVSRSGMSRSISVVSPDLEDVSYYVARALGDKIDQSNGGVKVGGCGMDMGFHLVYGLSRTLYPTYNCTGKRYRDEDGPGCPSNEHVNPGDSRDNFDTNHMHSDGYALSQRWL